MENEKKTVLLLGSHTPIALAIIRDLGRANYKVITIGDKNTIGHASRYCHHHYQRNIKTSDLIEKIIYLSQKYQAIGLIAISENDMIMLNKYRDTLELHLRLLIPHTQMLNQVLDKDTCLLHAQKCGIHIPKTEKITSIDNLKNTQLNFPVILKWSDPNHIAESLSKENIPLLKIEIAHTLNDLTAKLKRYEVIDQYPLIQEYSAGSGLGQMFLLKDGKVLLRFQHKRLHEWPPEGGVSTLCESIPLEYYSDLQNKSLALLKRLNWTGVAMVEYRYNFEKDTYVFMEVNGRFWGSLPLAIEAGVPFAASLVDMSLEQPIKQPDYRVIKSCYWLPETKRLFRILFQPHKIEQKLFKRECFKSIMQWLSLWIPFKHHYYIFKRDDPRPFIQDICNVCKKIISLCLKKLGF